MPKRVELHPAAVRESAAAYRWYAERNSLAAERFVAELDRAIERISQRPASFPKHLAGTRRSVLSRYPYLVVFQETDDVIRVIAVAHGRRRPGYWRKRVSQD
jgi:plasmid stabilization system protein ParE